MSSGPSAHLDPYSSPSLWGPSPPHPPRHEGHFSTASQLSRVPGLGFDQPCRGGDFTGFGPRPSHFAMLWGPSPPHPHGARVTFRLLLSFLAFPAWVLTSRAVVAISREIAAPHACWVAILREIVACSFPFEARCVRDHPVSSCRAARRGSDLAHSVRCVAPLGFAVGRFVPLRGCCVVGLGFWGIKRLWVLSGGCARLVVGLDGGSGPSRLFLISWGFCAAA